MHSAHWKAIQEKIQLLSEDERLELAASILRSANRKSSGGKKIDWSKFKGVLKSEVDPLEYQRRMRDEWN